MFHQFKLSTKVLGIIALILSITSGISFWIVQDRINRQAEAAFRDKLSEITGMASAIRSWFSSNLEVMVPNRNYKHLEQVPVVVALRSAERYAGDKGMKFRTPSLHPRDPKDQATEFEQRALLAFEKDPSLQEFAERATVDGQDVMRYAQPVRVAEDCLQCHGDPVGQKDPFGFPKEGMKVGELRAAFVVEAKTDALIKQSRSNMMVTFLISFLTICASIAILYFVLGKYVVRPVKRFAEFASTIAGKNLTLVDLEINSGDEIAEAMMAMNTMKNNLHEVVRSIADTSGYVASASEELSATSHQISAHSEETSSQAGVVAKATQQVNENLQGVSTGSEEMTATIQSIASNAHEAATVAANAVQTSEAANAAVAKLGESSAEIGEVVKVITSIAEQTNLLALNATIEAARAGEAGKGFAVVANEVKELAKQTGESTEDISRKIMAIQTDSKAAVQAIGAIAKVIHHVNDISSTIAAAVEEQSATTNEMTRNVTDAAKGSGEIAQNIEGVADAARSMSSSAQESQKAANDLAQMAARLQELVEQFQLADSTARSASQAATAGTSKSMAAHAGR